MPKIPPNVLDLRCNIGEENMNTTHVAEEIVGEIIHPHPPPSQVRVKGSFPVKTLNFLVKLYSCGLVFSQMAQLLTFGMPGTFSEH